MDNNHLLLGLNALARAHELAYFADGHRGGAIVSGVYLCRENEVEDGVAARVAAIVEEQWAASALCAPFADATPNPGLLAQITDCFGTHLGGLREAGHNVILPTLALKAFGDRPDALTPARAAGICRLIESFSPKDVPMAEPFALPDMADATTAAEFILGEFVDCTERFLGRGQGWSGHLLTYGTALLDLRAMGHTELAIRAEEGFNIYIRRIRTGPQDTDKQHAEHPSLNDFPLQTTYWQRHTGDLNLGHKLKYPYGFYSLMRQAQNPDLHKRCLAVAHRIF